jgi:6-phosphogluconolactonase/glucosamine-6-phosphate isomerase/deaminase
MPANVGASKVVPHMSMVAKPECRTIFMMGDERVSGEQEINNTLQLQRRYPGHAVVKHLISTVPEVHETPKVFAEQIEKNFYETISNLENLKIIALLGMGSDGHTAGIFPLPEDTFTSVYQKDDTTYVPVHVEGLTIDSRTSFTPTWILDKVDHVIGYVVGDSKSAILESLIKETKPINERSAEILKQHSSVSTYTDLAVEL